MHEAVAGAIPPFPVHQSPTVAAVLAIFFGAVNGQPPSTTLAIPQDFARTRMESIGLGAPEKWVSTP